MAAGRFNAPLRETPPLARITTAGRSPRRRAGRQLAVGQKASKHNLRKNLLQSVKEEQLWKCQFPSAGSEMEQNLRCGQLLELISIK